MSFFHENMLIGSSGQGGGAGYQIERSLRFNSADSPFLSHSVTSSSNQKCTISFWLKRTSLGGTHYICATHPFDDHMLWISGDKLSSTFAATSSATWSGTSAPVFRDPSAWYHVVIAFDTTKASASDRVRLYVNGNTVSWSSYIGPVQNTTFHWNSTQVIGRYDTTYGSFYLADFYTIDGQQLTANDFGQFDSNGIWQPKKYTGTFGSGGSYLSFADNSAATATTLGKDTSGNSNNWTPSNLSVTAGAGNDSLVDSPTNYGTDTGIGGSVRGNYCTLNPLVGSSSSKASLSNGNLQFTNAAGSTYYATGGTVAMTTGKWYFEINATVLNSNRYALIGISNSNYGYGDSVNNGVADTWTYYSLDGSLFVETVRTTAWSSSYGTGDVVNVAFDADTGKLFFGKNGVWANSSNPATGTNPAATVAAGTYFPVVRLYTYSTVPVVDANFGQRPFAYTAPSGFKALCTQNLPTPTITNGATAMDVKLYTGTDSSQTITGLGFSPDLVWGKTRNGSLSHVWMDTVRGTGVYLRSNLTSADAANTDVITSFNSNGFTLGSSSALNSSAYNYAAWCWDAGSSTVTNTAGSISGQVRANASAGFSVVTYTGTGTAGTIGHGLNVAPSLIFCKSRSLSADWLVYHSALGGTKYLWLNLADGAVTDNAAWNNTNPTSSVFSVRTGTGVNSSGATYVAYCWAPVAGYSAFGSYTGNGSTDGPFVYTGFRPRWFLIKNTTAISTVWLLLDTARDTTNVAGRNIVPSENTAESGNDSRLDFLSNGFKIRNTYGNQNNNNEVYIYAAFAENPFALARAR